MAITTIPGASNTDLTTLQGTELIDSFTLDSNDQYVDGLAGNDIVSSSTAIESNTIDTGADNDTITFSAEVLTSNVKLGTGNDKITLADFSGSVYGGSGQDSVIASATRTVTNALIRGDGGADDFDFINVASSIINVNADDDNIAITGTTTSSSVYGGRQKDTITISGKATDSLIRGDANEDNMTISGELSGAIINGNAGADEIAVSSSTIATSSVYGGKGIDTLNITGAAIYVAAGADADDVNLTGDAKHTVYGGTGNDSINSNSSKVLHLEGEAGDDEITVTVAAADSGVHTLNGGSGKDSITGSGGIESIDGGTEGGDDTLISGGGNDTILGRGGADVIKLNAAGTVSVQAGADNDTIELTLAHLTFEDTIKGEDGTDAIAVTGTAADFDMTAANSVAEKSFDSISSIETLAFGGDDAYTITDSTTEVIKLSTKAQTAGVSKIDVTKAVAGTAGVLEIDASTFTSSTNLTVIGADDKDVNIKITGGAGNDSITSGKIGEDAGDTLIGGDGVDSFTVVMTSNDVLITDLGNGGQESLIVTSAASGVDATVTADYIAPTTTSNSKSLADVKLTAATGVDINMVSAGGNFGYDIIGGAAASTLQGSNFNDSITGQTGADSLIGNSGNDTIEGKAGNDIINAGAGDDQIEDAGVGDDTIIYDSGTTLDVQNTGTGTVTLTASKTGVTVTADNGGNRVVNATSSSVAVNLNGNSIAIGTITYTGGSGADTIIGGDNNDTLKGLAGNDTLTGGEGDDELTGGDGANDFVFSATNGTDTIVDFVVANGDQLNVDAIVAANDGGVEALAANAVQVLSAATDDDIFVVNQAAAINGKAYDAGNFAELFGANALAAKAFVTTAPGGAVNNIIIVQGTDETHAYALVDAAGDDLVAAGDVTKIAVFTGLTNSTAVVDANIV